MDKFKLRHHQSQGIWAMRKAFSGGRTSIIRQAPTGSGKTFEFSILAMMASQKGTKVAILSDRTELLKQAGGSVYSLGLAPGYITAGSKVPPQTMITIGMMQTLRRRIGSASWKRWFDSIGLLIIDECHKQDANPFFVEKAFKFAKTIGFSATPKRSGNQRQLGLDYEVIVPGPSVTSLIKDGHLVPDRTLKLATPDMDGVAYDRKSGDYDSSSMYAKFNTPELYDGLIDNYHKHTPNTTILTFCVNIEHTIKTCIELNQNHVPSKFLVSPVAAPKKPKKDANESAWVNYEIKMKAREMYVKYYDIYSGDRDRILREYHAGMFPSMVNCGILATGYDFPAIETIGVCCATLSEQLWLQRIGRGSRTSKGKDYFNVLDFGGNTDRLGGYQQDRIWNIWHEPNKGGGVPPMKMCGERHADKTGKAGCKKSIPAIYKICPFCGYLFITEKEAKKAELEEHVYDQSTGKMKPVKEMSIDEMWMYRELMKFKIGWFARAAGYQFGADAMESFLKQRRIPRGQVQRLIFELKSENNARNVL